MPLNRWLHSARSAEKSHRDASNDVGSDYKSDYRQNVEKCEMRKNWKQGL